MQKEDQLTENQDSLKCLCLKFKSHQKAADGDVGDAQGERVLPHVDQAELQAVPRPHPRHHRLVVRVDTELGLLAAGPGHRRVLRAGVEQLVVSPDLPGLGHLLRHEAAAAQLGLGQVPGLGHRVVLVTGVIVPDVQDHLGLDGVDHLVPEDVGQHPAHPEDDHGEQGEHGVGQQQALDLLDRREAPEDGEDDDQVGDDDDDVGSVGVELVTQQLLQKQFVIDGPHAQGQQNKATDLEMENNSVL